MTHKENQPETVILVPLDNWQIGLASGGLIQAYKGPILFYSKDEIPRITMNEIKRLNPLGNNNGTQVIVIGEGNESVRNA